MLIFAGVRVKGTKGVPKSTGDNYAFIDPGDMASAEAAATAIKNKLLRSTKTVSYEIEELHGAFWILFHADSRQKVPGMIKKVKQAAKAVSF